MLRELHATLVTCGEIEIDVTLWMIRNGATAVMEAVSLVFGMVCEPAACEHVGLQDSGMTPTCIDQVLAAGTDVWIGICGRIEIGSTPWMIRNGVRTVMEAVSRMFDMVCEPAS